MTDVDRELDLLVEHGRDREAAALAVRHAPGQSDARRMDPLNQLDQLAPVLGAVVAGIGVDQLDAPTPCSELTVRGVLEHMVGGATTFAASFRGEPAPTAGGDVLGDPLGRFGPAMTELMDAVHAPGALERVIAGPFGDVPGPAFAHFVVLDGLVHGWDLATATGQPYYPPAALVADVRTFAAEAIAPAMREAKMFAEPAMAPADATPIEELVAFTGRRVERSPR